jgi:hypothetical protein
MHRVWWVTIVLGCSRAPDADGDGVVAVSDCDDRDAAIRPGADEVCDGVDNDCDGTVDVGAVNATTFYDDGDGDTYGAGVETVACGGTFGQVTKDGDCDDTNAQIHPGQSEVCDPADTDEDCDGSSDDEDPDVDPATSTTFFVDVDGDGYGAEAELRCDPKAGYAAVNGDCDDTSGGVHPGAAELCADGIDQDCSGTPERCRWAGDVPTADASALITGVDLDEWLGWDIAGVGDVNGDGVGDLATSTALPDIGYLFFGPVEGGPSTVADATFATTEAPVSMAPTVRGAGDQNDDGYCDLVLSRPDDNFGTGAAFVVLGPVTGEIDFQAVAAAVLVGDEEHSYFGVSAFGEVSGDGAEDLVIGAPGADGRGAVYVFYGPMTSGELDPTHADDSIIGTDIDSTFGGGWTGSRVTADGDVNGDGIDDLLISADRAFGVGLVALFLAPVNGSSYYDRAGDAVGRGNPSYEQYGGFGIATSIGGDVDGDGLNDVAVGAPHDQTGTRVAVFFAATVLETGDLDPDAADYTILGAVEDGVGWSVDTSGDFDGDNQDDLITGFCGEAGGACGLYGPLTGGTVAVVEASFSIIGSEWDLGYSTAFVGDTSGDGVDDVAIGAPSRASGGVADAGALYLFESESL